MKKSYVISTLAVATASADCASGSFVRQIQTSLGLTGATKSVKLSPEIFAIQPCEAEGIAAPAERNLRARFWAIGGTEGILPIRGNIESRTIFTVLSGDVEGITSVGIFPHGEH